MAEIDKHIWEGGGKMNVCDRCCCIESADNPVNITLTPEGYFYENVCEECSALDFYED
jgi:hypothetical protein